MESQEDTNYLQMIRENVRLYAAMIEKGSVYHAYRYKK
jgi:hypothetical protein